MDKKLTLTQHTTDRINQRLFGLVTVDEIHVKLDGQYFPQGKSFYEIKRIQYTEIQDPSVQPDGIARGDSIVAVVVNDWGSPLVKTVMLRKSWSKSNQYSVRRA